MDHEQPCTGAIKGHAGTAFVPADTVVEVLGDTPPVAVDGLSSLLTEEEKEKFRASAAILDESFEGLKM